MKAFAAPLVFALTAAAASPFLPSDGTPEGKVKLAITVSLATATIFAMIAAVLLSSLIPAGDARSRTDYLTTTKPVPRSCLFAGRVLGLCAVGGAMLAAMGAVTWLFAEYTAWRVGDRRELLAVRRHVSAVWETGPARGPQEGPGLPVEIAPRSRVRLHFPVASAARRGVPPRGRVAPELAEAVGMSTREAREGLEFIVANPETGEARRVSLTDMGLGRGFSFPVPPELVAFDERDARRPGRTVVEIENPRSTPVRLESRKPVLVLSGRTGWVRPGEVYRWDFDVSEAGEAPLVFRGDLIRGYKGYSEVEFVFRSAGKTVAKRSVPLTARRSISVRLEGAFLPEGDLLTVLMHNTSPGTVRMALGEGLVLAPRAGTFLGAVARWWVLEVVKLGLVVLVTCAGAAALSFPIPALLGGLTAGGGYLAPFVLALTSPDVPGRAPDALVGVLRILLTIFPDMTKATASGTVAEGVLVPAGLVVSCLLSVLVLRGGIAGLLGAWLYTRREIAG